MTRFPILYASLLSGEPVFVTAKGLVPGGSYRVWLLCDRREWNDGDVFKSWGMEIGAGIWPGGVPEFIELTADDEGTDILDWSPAGPGFRIIE